MRKCLWKHSASCMKTDECKDRRFFPAWTFNRATTPSNTLKYNFYRPSHTLLCYLLSFHLIICFQTIPVALKPRSNITRRRQRDPANLRPIYIFYYTSFFFLCGSLEFSVSCQQSRTSFCFSLQSTLSILGLTETWIRPEDSATQLPSLTISLSITPTSCWPGWGHCSAHFNNWKCSTHSALSLPYAIQLI